MKYDSQLFVAMFGFAMMIISWWVFRRRILWHIPIERVGRFERNVYLVIIVVTLIALLVGIALQVNATEYHVAPPGMMM